MTESPTDEKEIFEVARKINLPEARVAFLQQTCGENEALNSACLPCCRPTNRIRVFWNCPRPDWKRR